MTHAQTRLLAHTLPYPVSRAICAIDAEPERAADRRLLHLLYALEGLTQLLGSAVLVDAFGQRDDASVREALKGLQRTNHVTMGLWCWVLVNLAPKLPRPFLPELTAAAGSVRFREQIERLAALRNFVPHPIRPLDVERSRALLVDARTDFDALVESVSFLGGYHLLGVLDEPRPTAAALRITALPLRGKDLAGRDVTLQVEGRVRSRDVLLVNPGVTEGLALRPFFLASVREGSEDVLVLSREDGGRLCYYAAGRPDTTVREPLLSDDADRPLELRDWLKTPSGPAHRFNFPPDTARRLDERRVLHTLRDGGPDLPLRDLRHFRSGGMSEVFTGFDPVAGVARILKAPRDPSDRSVRQHFESEYATLARIRHEGIIAVFSFREIDGVGPCIVEELFDHPTLQEHLAGGAFDHQEVEAVLLLLLEAVGALHAQRVVHRDLKPANILYDRGTQRLKVIDLGIARRLDATSNPTTRAGRGTPAAMAPEQVRGGEITPATDVYALAMLARALYCGLDSYGHAAEVVTFPSIPVAVRAVLARAAADGPTERHSDAAALRDALQAAFRGDATSPPETVAPNLAHHDAAVSQAINRAFNKAHRRLRKLRQSVGFTTAPEEFRRALERVFVDVRAELSVAMAPLQWVPAGGRPDVLRSAMKQDGDAAASGAMTVLGGLAGATVPLVGMLASGAFAVMTRKSAMVSACDAAEKTLDGAYLEIARVLELQ